MMRARGSSRLAIGILAGALTLGSGSHQVAMAMDDGGGRSVFATGAGNRALSLGGAYTAVADDASASIWNPAGLALVPRSQLQATQTSLFGLGFSEQYASFVLPHWRWGTASVTYRRFGVDGIEGRDERGFLYDDDLQDAETEIGLGYAHLIAGGDLALGGVMKVQSHELAGYSDTGLGADLGIWARPLALAGSRVGAEEFSLGMSLRNVIEPEIKLDRDAVSDPLTLRLGAAWQQAVAAGVEMLVASDLERSRDMDTRWHAGLECRLQDVLALRAGTSDGMLTAGAGLVWRGIGADYQYEDNELGDVHRFGVSLSFGVSREESRRKARLAAENALQERLDAAFQARVAEQVREIEIEIRHDLEREHWNEALDGVGTLAVLDPSHAELAALEAAGWCGIARDQERRDELASAMVSFRRALELLPDDPTARRGLQRVQAESDRRAARGREIKACFETALTAFAQGKLITARDGFRTVLRLSPDDAEAAAMLERTNAAITAQAASLAQDAMELAEADRLEVARTRLASARRLDADAPGLAAAAASIRRGEQRELELAAAELTTTPIPKANDIAAAPAPIARPERTLSDARRRELADLYRRGLAAMESGRSGEAMRYWELVWSADPDHGRVREYLAQEYLTRGMESYAAGSLQAAVVSWENALRVAPDDERARGYLERARAQLDRMEQISSRR
jgi:tetratricopeptide (TPR) repeat protein